MLIVPFAKPHGTISSLTQTLAENTHCSTSTPRTSTSTTPAAPSSSTRIARRTLDRSQRQRALQQLPLRADVPRMSRSQRFLGIFHDDVSKAIKRRSTWPTPRTTTTVHPRTFRCEYRTTRHSIRTVANLQHPEHWTNMGLRLEISHMRRLSSSILSKHMSTVRSSKCTRGSTRRST